MTTSPIHDETSVGLLGQILLKQGEMTATLAVITEKLSSIPDHELRIRNLERFRYTLAGIAIVGGLFAAIIGGLIGHFVK